MSNDALSRARALLRDGKVQEADDLISATLTEQEHAAAAAAGTLAAPPPPRAPQAVLLDLFSTINARLGNVPALDSLIAELHTVSKA